MCWLFLTWIAYAQDRSTLSEELQDRVAALFEPWEGKSGPGVSFAIIKDGSVIYQKNAGLADIEAGVPITSKTQFNLARSSKHFTAYGVLKLVVAGKVQLEDDARKYIASLQKLGQLVTVRDLLFGTSGIYDFGVLKAICGWKPLDAFSQEDVLQLVSLQQKTAFEPGTSYSWSDTNFALLAKLIAQVSGKSFKKYMEEEVFLPLGMNHTIILEDMTDLPSQVAHSYRTEGENVILVDLRNTVLGMNNIYSCVDDLILWEDHLGNADGEVEKVATLMNTLAKLKNGRTNHTSYGELTLGQLYGHMERGLFSTYITGSLGGHDSSIFKFPEHSYTAIALSNNGRGYNGFLGVIAAHHILGEHFTEPETTDFGRMQTKVLASERLKLFEGHYWDRLGELSRQIKVKDDTLRYVRANGYESSLIPLSSNEFQMKVPYDDKVYILFPKGDPNAMIYQYDTAEPIFFERYTPISLGEEELEELYQGSYLNEEYGIAFNAEAKQNELIISNAKVGSMRFSPIKSMLFSGDRPFMRSIEFMADDNDSIRGFYIRNDAIRNLWFEKVK